MVSTLQDLAGVLLLGLAGTKLSSSDRLLAENERSKTPDRDGKIAYFLRGMLWERGDSSLDTQDQCSSAYWKSSKGEAMEGRQFVGQPV